MIVLAFDTSSMTGTACVYSAENGRILAEAQNPVSERHGETLLPFLSNVLERARTSLSEIGLIACGAGPGSFTGLRVGLATAKGIGFGRKIPLVTVSSLAAFAAEHASAAECVAVVTDAHKSEVYFAAYDSAGEEVVEPAHAKPAEAAIALEKLAHRFPSVRFCGNGIARYPEFFSKLDREAVAPSSEAPRASEVAKLGLARFRREGPSDPMWSEPLYVRGSDAKVPAGLFTNAVRDKLED